MIVCHETSAKAKNINVTKGTGVILTLCHELLHPMPCGNLADILHFSRFPLKFKNCFNWGESND
jgi:hypothetical protein